MTSRPAIATILASALISASCTRVPPSVLDPVAAEHQLRARTFEAPGLAEFARAQAGNSALAWPPGSFGPQELLWTALFFSDDLKAARAGAAVREAALSTARQRVNPSVSGEAGRNKTPESVATYGISTSFTIETAGKRGYRILEAEKELEAARIGVWETAWRVRSRLRAAFLAAHLAFRRGEILHAEEAARESVAALLEKRLAAGEIARPELTAAQAELATARLAGAAAKSETNRAFAELAAATGVTPDVLAPRILIQTSVLEVPDPASLPVLQVQKAGLLHRADLRRRLAQYEAADAGYRLALANRYPNISLNPAYTFQEGFPAYVLGAAVDALPVFHRNDGPAAERKAERDRVEAEFRVLQAAALSDTRTGWERFRAAAAEWQEARTRFAAAQTARALEVETAFRAGESDRLDMIQAKLFAVAAQRAELEARERALTALLALEDAVQADLGGGMKMGEVR